MLFSDRLVVEGDQGLDDFRRGYHLRGGEVHTENKIAAIHVPVLRAVCVKLAQVKPLRGCRVAQIDMALFSESSIYGCADLFSQSGRGCPDRYLKIFDLALQLPDRFT